MSGLVLTPIERRVLAHLEQRGGKAHREAVVCDLASAKSRIGSRGGKINGSNGATPLIMGKWCSRLIKQGMVYVETCRDGFYSAHVITGKGAKALRNAAQADEERT